MIYRESGQFKTSYAADAAIFPIAQDRWFVSLIVAAAVLVPPLAASEYWLQAILIPFLVYSLAAIGLNLLTGYAGQLSLGTGGFMAVGAYAAYKVTTAFPQISILGVVILARVVAAGGGAVLGIPRPPHQGVLSGRGHPGRAVLPHLALQQGPVVHQLRVVRHHHRAAPLGAGGDGDGPAGHGRRALPGCAGTGGRLRPGGQEPRAGASGPGVDGHSRPGHRGGDHRHPAPADEAPGLRRQLLLLRGGGSRAGLPVPGQRRDPGLRHQHLVSRAVHGHHRRPREHPGLVARRRLHRAGAHLPDQRPAPHRAPPARGAPQANRADDLRSPHHRLSDRRTARTGSPVAPRQGEAAPLALSPLNASDKEDLIMTRTKLLIAA